MATRDIIVVGASAGGVEALQNFVRALPPNFPGSIFITLHFPENGTSVMPRILSRAGPLPAVHAANGESIVPGRIYIAPPDNHLLLTTHGLRVVRGPKENGHRPAVDPMFRSAAVAFGPRVIGVVLSGSLDDGTSGLAAIKRRGGLALVQDPQDALYASMPQSAIDHVKVDRVAAIKHLSRTLIEMMATPIPDAEFPVTRDDAVENDLSAGDTDVSSHPEEHPGEVSSFGCPDCGGVLWQLRDGDFVRFRCRVGHAWTGDALIAKQSDVVDEAMWVALRALEESAQLSRQIGARHEARGSSNLARRFLDQANAIERRADSVRLALVRERDAEVPPDIGTANPRRAS
jgi:two-component system, chemotaxis family, protein-glutamate methylesterase/glutaminase